MHPHSQPPAHTTSAAAPPLRLLFWESTSRCNLACLHCRRLEVQESAAAGDLTTAQAKAVFDSAATLGKPVIVFSGGEPLMRPDWQELALHVRSLGLPSALATNGTLIDAPMAGRIAAVGFHRVSISLDGAGAATHDAFRGIPGAFEQALTGARLLRKASVALQINATVAAHNAHQLDALLALARSLDACAMHLFLLVPVGCGTQIGESHQLAARTYEQVLGWMCDRQAELAGQFEIKATCAPHYYRLAAQRGIDTGHGRGCLCGVSVAFVSHRGEVFPCGYLPVDCGSVRQQPFAETWRSSQVFADLRDPERLEGKCGECAYKRSCGGCRARAYAATGRYLGPEPACGHLPASMRRFVR